MRTRQWIVLLSTLMVTACLAWAQASRNTGPKYDLSKEVKIKGVVQDIQEVPGEFEGTRLVVKTETKVVIVRVGPSDFLKEIDTSFSKGDQVLVVGAEAPTSGGSSQEELLAREITVGQNTTTLRDDKGIPVWAGWKPSKTTGK